MISILICTYGDSAWEDLAWSRAYPSAAGQSEDVFVLHCHDCTLAQVRNEAAERAEGDWLCFLDADDELAPDYVTAMEQAIEPILNPTPSSWAQAEDGVLLVPQVQYVHPDGSEDEPRFPNRQKPMTELNHAVIGTLVPRELFLEVGGFGEEPIYEDWSLWLRMIRAGASMVDVPAAVYRAFLGDGRNTSAYHREHWYWRIRREHERAVAGR